MPASQVFSGTGDPNGVVDGNPGDFYQDQTGKLWVSIAAPSTWALVQAGAEAVVFDDAVAGTDSNIRSNRAANQSPVDNTQTGETNLGSQTHTDRPAATGTAGLYSTIGGGNDNTASVDYSTVVGGKGNVASGVSSTAAGAFATASGLEAVAMGSGPTASGDSSAAFNTGSASGEGSFSACGGDARGDWSSAIGFNCRTNNAYSHAQGRVTATNGDFSHAEGDGCTADGEASHAEGSGCTAGPVGFLGRGSHAEGELSQTAARGAHAEGGATLARGLYSHSQGDGTDAQGAYSDAIGSKSNAHRTSQTALASGDDGGFGGSGSGAAQTSSLVFHQNNTGVGPGVNFVLHYDNGPGTAFFDCQDLRAYDFEATLVLNGKTAGPVYVSKTIRKKFSARCVAGVAVIAGSGPIESYGDGPASWNFTFTVSGADRNITFTVTPGGADTNEIYASMHLEFTEVRFVA